MHISVMPEEAISLLAIRPEGIYLDATAGLGGHTAQIAQRLSTGYVIASDRDTKSLEMARSNTEAWAQRICFHYGSFGTLADAVHQAVRIVAGRARLLPGAYKSQPRRHRANENLF